MAARGHSPQQISTKQVPSLVSDRKSTRLNSSHPSTSYAVLCAKKKLVIALAGGYLRTAVPAPNSIAVAPALLLTYSDGTESARLGTHRVTGRLNQVSPAAQHAV